jgi:hypothetical protein
VASEIVRRHDDGGMTMAHTHTTAQKMNLETENIKIDASLPSLAPLR